MPGPGSLPYLGAVWIGYLQDPIEIALDREGMGGWPSWLPDTGRGCVRLDVELVNRLMVVHLSSHPQVALSDVRRKKGECDWTQQIGPLTVVISASSSDTGVRDCVHREGLPLSASLC